MSLPSETGAIFKKMKSKHRNWLRNCQKRLEASFPNELKYIWLTHLDDIPSICKKLESVAALTYQRSLAAGFRDNEEYRKRFELLNKAGQLRIQLLEIDNNVKAFWIGKIYGTTFYSEATSYDPNFKKFSLGNLILAKMVDELSMENIKQFDFGFGDAHYKSRFGHDYWYEATVEVFAPTLKGRSLFLIMNLFKKLNKISSDMLEKYGLIDRIKTTWRNFLTNRK